MSRLSHYTYQFTAGAAGDVDGYEMARDFRTDPMQIWNASGVSITAIYGSCSSGFSGTLTLQASVDGYDSSQNGKRESVPEFCWVDIEHTDNPVTITGTNGVVLWDLNSLFVPHVRLKFDGSDATGRIKIFGFIKQG